MQLPANPPQIHRAFNAEDVAILRVIVGERLAAKSEAPSGTYLVVADQTVTFCPSIPEAQQKPPCISPPLASVFPERVLPLVPQELKLRLVQENLDSVRVPPIDVPGARVVPAREVEDIFAGKGWWPEFYRRFPHSSGYLQITKPVLSTEENGALVYVTHSCGGLCGSGWLMYLSRKSGSWRVVDRYMLWIS